MGSAIFQDYLFSRFRNTGFYISESFLYNTIWIFLLPLGVLEFSILKQIKSQRKVFYILTLFVLGILFSLVHILLFTLSFVGISLLVFVPSHRFLRIFKSALANQFHILFLFYLLAPYLYQFIRERQHKPGNTNPTTTYASTIRVKSSTTSILIEVRSIQFITTDKPYTAIVVHSEKYLHNNSLKKMEALLDPQYFIRVHRSTILNLSFVQELKSRQNGDYDALLENGQSVRLSRHYKNNWEKLLH